MFYIVGLGNKGEEYENTRHNVGWLVLRLFLEEHQLPTLVTSSKYSGSFSTGVVKNNEVSVLFPDTFMNNSGSAVRKLVPKEQVGQLIVIYDDIDLPLGEVKVSFGRGSGGHNGLASVISAMGTQDFVRVRVGISPKSFWTGGTKRPKGERLPKYVLGRFTKTELVKVNEVEKLVSTALVTILNEGYGKAMNQFN